MATAIADGERCEANRRVAAAASAAARKKSKETLVAKVSLIYYYATIIHASVTGCANQRQCKVINKDENIKYFPNNNYYFRN